MTTVAARTNIPRAIAIETEAAKRLLLAIRSLVEDDEQAQVDAVEGETNLIEAIGMADERIADIDAYDAALSDRIAVLKARQERFANQRETLRAAILNAMSDIGAKKIEVAAATISISRGSPKLDVFDAELVPTSFLVEKVEVKPDKKAILEALKNGATIAGCGLSNPAPTLTIRRR